MKTSLPFYAYFEHHLLDYPFYSEVKCMPEVKFLGMRITENLSWHAHICCLCHSLSKPYFIIKSVKKTL